MRQGNGRAALDSRGCLPPVCSGRGRGGDLLFLAEREQPPPCPVCEAGRWSCHLGFTTSTPQPSPARDTFPSAGLSWSRVCAAKAGPLGDSADGTRLGRRLPRRHGWHPWRGGRLQKVGNGSPRNSIANTRPTETVVGALQSHVYLRHSATTCGLELAHAPLLAYTHTLDCHRL